MKTSDVVKERYYEAVRTGVWNRPVFGGMGPRLTSRETYDEETVQMMLEEARAQEREAYAPGGPMASRGRATAAMPFPSRGAPSRALPGVPTTEIDPRESEAFGSFLRTGINASMTTTADPDGGYLAPPQIANEIILIGGEQGAIRSLARGFQPASGDFRLPVSPTLAGAGRSSEGSTRSETTNPKLAMFHPPSGGLYAVVPLTTELLQDATFDVEQFVRESTGVQFGVTESGDFVSGSGVDRAFGFESYPLAATPDATRPWGQVEKLHAGSVSAFDIDDVIDLVAKLAPRYRKRAAFVMHPDTEAYARKLKASTSGDYYWQPSVAAGMPNTLLGLPTFIDVNMPVIASAAGVIAVADWQKFYGVVDIGPMSTIRDPYTNKGSVLFYTEKRVGGGVIDFNAGKILVMSV